MTLTETLFMAVISLGLAVLLLGWLVLRTREKLAEALSRKQSLSVKYGKMTEQFFPFLTDYPYDSRRFRFLGTPVDGVQFNDDGIVFVEFKAAGSGLSQEQRRIRQLVLDGKVGFEEVRIKPPENE